MIATTFPSRALVLLSGGLDSTAALHHTLEKTNLVDVRAVGFDYGQPHRTELQAAHALCARRRVPFTVLPIALPAREPPAPGVDNSGVSRANVPTRNLLFLSLAAAYAMQLWPGRNDVALIIGCNEDDAKVFPDCRLEFLLAVMDTLELALKDVGHVRIGAPWISHTKAGVVAWCKDRPDALHDILASVSCYHATEDRLACGTCDACTLRESALAAHDLRVGGKVTL